MAFQVCTRDEYGQTANMFNGKFDILSDAITAAKEAVTNDNINNALTSDEKRRNWTSCFVELFDDAGEPDPNAVYGGIGIGASDIVYMMKKNGAVQTDLKDTNAIVRVFIGQVMIGGKDETWYGQDARGKDIDSPTHRDLADKTIYYIRQVP